ncbi:sulfatase-like hydrolase/transferase [Paenibacillus cymbidii]|uniref:sulfatase-like hydrolase/transferase n=1 Tax=Paenibacillus cymbidii TaxID=1639034 RepID=UPI001081CB95|nr:sulfatase-like hydrolase/transferase [Paenibacillus cymbidii]
MNKDNSLRSVRKNVVFILIDDLGWMDVALNGSTYYETPNVQRLACEGMTFTHAYAHPLCSPSRSAILTGQYPHRTGINNPGGHLPDNTEGFQFDGDDGPVWQKYVTKKSLTALPAHLYTIGQAFQENGYKTGFIGKHHLGVGSEYQMKNRGFDVDLGMPVPGPGCYYDPYFPHIPGNVFDTGSLFLEGENITDRLAREADRFIAANKDNPFLLEMWDFSVHAPFQGKKEYIDYFRKKHVPESPQNGNFHMAAMLKTMDDAVGKILDSLESNGISDRTMVVFIGDNGGNMYDAIDGHFPTNNYPLRQGKGTIYEGGIRVPCIVKVPGVTTPGSSCSENIHVVDFYPTLLDYAEMQVPDERFRQNGQVLDGESIMPLLRGERQSLPRAGVFTNFIANVPAPGNTASAAINSGKWKLIVNYELMGGLKQKYELYDLDANISETVNLASQFPEKVTELESYILAHQECIPQAKPKLNPSYIEGSTVPVAFRRWDEWVKEFTRKVENDPDLSEAGAYPKIVLANETTAFYKKIHHSLIMKIGKFTAICNKYDGKITNRQVPVMVEDIPFIPLEFVVTKLGYAYSQTGEEATITLHNQILTLKINATTINGKPARLRHAPVLVNDAFMLPLPECQTIIGKSAIADASGLIIIDDDLIMLTDAEIAMANRLIDSFADYDHAYWNAENTITMVNQAEMEDEWEQNKQVHPR